MLRLRRASETYLEDTPRDTAEGLSSSKHVQRRSEGGNGNKCCHPDHEYEECSARSNLVLAVRVDEEAKDLTDLSGVGDAGLPHGRNGLLASSLIVFAEAFLELGLTVEGSDLAVVSILVYPRYRLGL